MGSAAVADLPKGVYIVISDVIGAMQSEDGDSASRYVWAGRATPRRIVSALLTLERLRMYTGSKPHPIQDIRSAIDLLIPVRSR